MTHSKRTKPSQNSVTSLGQHAVSAQPHSAVRQKQLASPGQAEFALCEQTIFDVSIPIRIICSTNGLLCLRSATDLSLAQLMPSGAVHTNSSDLA
jgi:hypothetical protein